MKVTLISWRIVAHWSATRHMTPAVCVCVCDSVVWGDAWCKKLQRSDVKSNERTVISTHLHSVIQRIVHPFSYCSAGLQLNLLLSSTACRRNSLKLTKELPFFLVLFLYWLQLFRRRLVLLTDVIQTAAWLLLIGNWFIGIYTPWKLSLGFDFF